MIQIENHAKYYDILSHLRNLTSLTSITGIFITYKYTNNIQVRINSSLAIIPLHVIPTTMIIFHSIQKKNPLNLENHV